MELITSETWTLEQVGERPLTTNQERKLDKFACRKVVKQLRSDWAWLARQARVPALDSAVFTVTPLHADGRSPQDPSACHPAFKAALDGIVDAGCLPDDDGRFVHAITFLPPDICGRDGLRIVIEGLRRKGAA